MILRHQLLIYFHRVFCVCVLNLLFNSINQFICRDCETLCNFNTLFVLFYLMKFRLCYWYTKNIPKIGIIYWRFFCWFKDKQSYRKAIKIKDYIILFAYCGSTGVWCIYFIIENMCSCLCKQFPFCLKMHEDNYVYQLANAIITFDFFRLYCALDKNVYPSKRFISLRTGWLNFNEFTVSILFLI